LASLAKQERVRHVERVKAGMARARDRGVRIGRARIPAAKERAIRAALAAGEKGMLRIAAEQGVGSGTVQRIKAEMRAGALAAPA
jgi:DNA invertase Pin-like site-specific DNA recombinase